ncbi:hypothetical protein HAX54_013810, partial [Datura stramonium]|nr:hypothetical protein [Datura stramonium]
MAPKSSNGKVVASSSQDLISESEKVEEEEVNYRMLYDPKELDVIKTKKTESMHGPVLFISELNVHIDNILSH